MVLQNLHQNKHLIFAKRNTLRFFIRGRKVLIASKFQEQLAGKIEVRWQIAGLPPDWNAASVRYRTPPGESDRIAWIA